MPINILMPALSPTMEKGNLAKWLKKEGDKVKSGDVIAEIETDKATMEVEAVDEGTIAKILVPEGTQDVPVNDIIAVLAGDGEDVKAAGAGGRARTESPPKRREARCCACASGPNAGTRARSSTRTAPQAAAAPAKTNGHARVFSSPLARRLAKEAGIDIARINGSGPHGRIVARDVEGAKSGKGLKAPAAAPGAAPAHRAGDVGQADPFAVRGRLLRDRAARRHAPHHRAAPDGGDAERSDLLSHHRLRHRPAARRARADQCRRTEGQGEEAALQAVGQRLRHQGARGRVAAGAGLQCQLDRGRHGQAQAFRHRRRRRDARRADHADHPQRREQVAVDHLQRDEGSCGPRADAKAQAAGISGRHDRRFPISACSASSTSPP